MNKEAQTAGAVVSRLTSEMKGHATTRSTITVPPQSESQKKAWLDTWLGLKDSHHPALTGLKESFYAFCAGIWRTPDFGSTLVIYGANGTGKTHCARKLSNWIRNVGGDRKIIEKENHVIFLQSQYQYWPRLLDVLKDGGWGILDDMVKVPVLILDDIGAGHDPSKVGTDKLGQLLTRRERLWNLVTTNVAPDRWETVFDRRVASRLFRNSEIVDLSGVPDFSIK